MSETRAPADSSERESDSKAAVRVVCAVIENAGRYLITQRRPSAVLPLLWEFPGGKVEEGESDQLALVRELDLRLGVQIEVAQLISFVRHPYERYSVELYLYECRIVAGTPSPRHVADFRWVSSKDFEAYSFTPADEASMAQLLDIK
jgi:8-oxo-dGTP diphosphatase